MIGKILKLDIEWDDKLPEEICAEMKTASRDMEMLSELNFPRQTLNEQISYGLHIFCDSSVESYEFVAYALDQNDNNSILFSKPNMVLSNKRNEHSVPPFEFLGVILAFKCLPRILEAYDNIQFQSINICVDAQVVLKWLITKETKLKSKFVIV